MIFSTCQNVHKPKSNCQNSCLALTLQSNMQFTPSFTETCNNNTNLKPQNSIHKFFFEKVIPKETEEGKGVILSPPLPPTFPFWK